MGRFIDKAMKMQEIVDKQQIRVGNKIIDISDMLSKTSTKTYREKDISNIKVAEIKGDTKCSLIECSSVDVAFNINLAKYKKAILNFASSKSPGGGFRNGASAQEECLCFHSNLGVELEKHEDFYEYNVNHKNRGLYTDGILYNKDVVFFMKDFKETEPVHCDVITCPAPNAGASKRNGVTTSEINKTMEKRIEQVFKVAIDNGVEVLALGAFGCGVFKNDPDFVAKTMRDMLQNKYGTYFKHVVFPLLSKNDKNYEAFKKYFN